MEHLSNGPKNCPNQHENSHKLCDEMGHPILSLTESQWKLRQQHDQWRENHCKKIIVSEEINLKEPDFASHSLESE